MIIWDIMSCNYAPLPRLSVWYTRAYLKRLLNLSCSHIHSPSDASLCCFIIDSHRAIYNDIAVLSDTSGWKLSTAHVISVLLCLFCGCHKLTNQSAEHSTPLRNIKETLREVASKSASIWASAAIIPHKLLLFWYNGINCASQEHCGVSSAIKVNGKHYDFAPAVSLTWHLFCVNWILLSSF